MDASTKLKQSRENWKQKAIERGDKERYYKKENHRLKRQRYAHKKRAKEAEAQLDTERKKSSPCVQDKGDLIYIALQLFTVARIGFRAISRVMNVLKAYLGIAKVPCPQTIINWVTRYALVKIQKPCKSSTSPLMENGNSNGFIWMIDISIGLGAGKILTVLALDAQHHRYHTKAPTLQDVHCLAVSVSKTWTGELIAAFLSRVIAVTGPPAAFLKDGGTDLGKATRLLTEQGTACVCIDDISHKIANLLKHAYGKHPLFEHFLSSCGRVSKKLKQTMLACLAPPKVSVKARFMNLHRLVVWADQLLSHSPPGAAKDGSLLEKLRQSLDGLLDCKSFISRFLRDARPLLDCQKILKNQGLSQQTVEECERLVQAIPSQSAIRTGFMQWLNNQLDIAETLGVEDVGLPISTDQLESLFGLGKCHGIGEIKDANRIAIRQPVLCGELTKEDARRVLEVSVQQQNELLQGTSSLIKQRRDVLPNPGTLDSLVDASGGQNVIEFIPGSGNRSKNTVKPCGAYLFEKSNGPSLSDVSDDSLQIEAA